MRIFLFILHFSLSMVFITSPILGLNFELNYQSTAKMTCCTELSVGNNMDMENSCHDTDVGDKHDCKDNCKDNCHDHAAQVLTHSLQPPLQDTRAYPKENLESLNISEFYQNLFSQQFANQFWNPPKVV